MAGRNIFWWMMMLALPLHAQSGGTIKSNSGQPIPGAIVQIVGARDRGTNAHWAEPVHADVEDPAVGIVTTTKSDGSFSLPPLDNKRLYHLGIFAPRVAPFIYWGFDPNSNNVEIRLPPSRPPTTEKYVLHGRVVGPAGKPLAGLFVQRDGVELAQGRGWGWAPTGWNDDVMTDTNGEFFLRRTNEFTGVQVRVRAHHLANAMEWLYVTNAIQTIQMNTGMVLTGRVVKDGKPLAGLSIGVMAADRNSEVFAGHYETKTRDDGVFEFPHLPRASWYVYGIVSSVKPYGALAPRLVGSLPTYGFSSTPAAPTNTGPVDLGDWPVKPGLRLAGHVKTRSGEPLPKKTRLSIGVENTWDSETVSVESDGSFSLDGLPQGIVTIYFQPRKWHFTANNRNLDPLNPALTGQLDKDKLDLLLEIERQDSDRFLYGGNNGFLPPADQPQTRPLSGVEPSGIPYISVSGQVVDDDTGLPLPRFKVTKGYKPPPGPAMGPPPSMIQKLLEPLKKKPVPWNEYPYWFNNYSETETNGKFLVNYLPLSSRPLFRIEADGYEPFESEPISNSTQNIIVRLKRGVGPSGIVLLPDGAPAQGATVIYAAIHETLNLNSNNLDYNGRPNDPSSAQQTTGQDGKFSFPPKPQGRALFVAHPQGWYKQPLSKSGQTLKIRLEPWSTVTGTLVYPNGSPAVAVELAVSPMGNYFQDGEPFLYMNDHCLTDAAGHFTFHSVPPGTWNLDRIQRMAAPVNGWRNIPQTWFTADPGITNDLQKVTYDTPPPPPFSEQVKRKLGL